VAEFALAVLADSAIVSREGKLSVIGIFRNITLRKLPDVFPRFSVVAILSQVDRPLRVGIEVVDLKKNEVIVKLPEGRLAPAKLGDNVQLVVDLANIPFKSAGHHEVRIMLDQQVKKFIPFEVNLFKKNPIESKPLTLD